MIVQSLISRFPGTRIEGYRNSKPRIIKLLAVGPNAAGLISDLDCHELGHVLMTGRIDPENLTPMDDPVDGVRPNAVIVVHEEGEAEYFPFLIERTASMLSLIVLLDDSSIVTRVKNDKVKELRAISDLFVTTTDRSFVRELVYNLAS